MNRILLNKKGEKMILLGNEAVIRGALESGVGFVSTYPGTPASEIGNVFYKISKKVRVYFEFSTNEKVAIEAAAGASFSGLRSLVAMKHFGLNVASDFLLTLMYSGVRGGMVIFVADDPSGWSSAQSEQNSRAYSYLAHIPTLEPSDPQECKDFTNFAFQISGKFKMPVMIRTTTRVAHQRAPIVLGRIPNPRGPRSGREVGGLESKIPEFVKEPERWVTMPPRVLEMKKELLEKIEVIKKFSENSKINHIARGPSSNNFKMGIITVGISYLYVSEALKELNIKLPVLKLGFFYPLPEEKIRKFIKNLKKVLIVEELEPYLEKEVKRLAKDINPKLKIFGKDLIPEIGELKPEIVLSAVLRLTNKKSKIGNWKLKIPVLKRSPRLCPGCPYWLVLSAIGKAVNPEEVIFGGDIGCYMLFGRPPLNFQDYLSCMGSSIGIAHGIKKATKQKLITFIGDSTFFHAGIPALINTVFNKSNPLIIILDNQTTAMTGHQPHPGAPATPNGIKIGDIVLACGVKNLKVIDQENQEEFIKAVKEFLTKDEVSVIIARHPCLFVKNK